MEPARPRAQEALQVWGRAASRTLLSFSFLTLLSLPLWAQSQLTTVSGGVELKRRGEPAYRGASQGARLESGDQVRTAPSAKAEITLDDGSKVALGSRSAFTLEQADKGQARMSLAFGYLRAWVRKAATRGFQVRTPTAVCSVRGTEFGVDVDPASLRTQVDLYQGLLGVEDNKGNSLLLQEGQRLSVDQSGLGTPVKLGQALEQEKQAGQQALKAEVGLAMSKEAVLAAAAEEIKLAEYQQGKTMVDVFGNRVRLEEYILRPTPDQFKLVVLNEREERFDYFFYQGLFNTTLPTDLSLALRQLSGTPGAAPDWYLKEYRTGRSNTLDSVVERSYGGHPVDVNNNGAGNTSDDVTSYFDSALDQFVSVGAGTPFYKTLYDYYRIWYNPADPNNPQEPSGGTPFPQGLTYRWDPSGVTPFDGTPGTGIQNMGSHIATTIFGGNGNYSIDQSFPDGTLLHHRIKETYGTGDDFTQYDNYIINDDGQLASLADFSGANAGISFKETLLKWNFQQVITSSFFGDRKIDLVVEPKILIQSGLSGFSQ